MVGKLGTETLADFYSPELTHAAMKLVTEVRPISPGQEVLITADTAADWRVAQATAAAVHTVGGIPTLISYPTLAEPMQDAPAPVAGAAVAADVWVNFSVAYQLYSKAYHQAIDAGCVYVELTGMDVDMLVRTVGRVDYAAIQEMATRLYVMSQAAEQVRITCDLGTDLTMTIDPAGDPFFEDPPSQGGYAQMLGGQSGYMAHRESYQGVLVYDGTIWPPASIGLLAEPVSLSIENGCVTRVEGGRQARAYKTWLGAFDHPAARLMDHSCYGFNPGVTEPTGRILEDERVFGCMQFGLGASAMGSPIHSDGVVLSPSVWLDDVQIQDHGRYVHPELAELCRSMGATGY
ncbi:MAG: hypothetical protein GWP04_02925 [Gammaproteobacteria bacterium]|nr:hypothetical protein [Gammaproteobacteria bacterium]